MNAGKKQMLPSLIPPFGTDLNGPAESRVFRVWPAVHEAAPDRGGGFVLKQYLARLQARKRSEFSERFVDLKIDRVN